MIKNEHAQLSRRERKKAEKLARIEAAARRLFAEHGYDGTTTRAIAEEAEIATGTLFVYFPGKLELLIHLYARDLEAVITEAMDALPEDLPLVEALTRTFDAVYGFYEGNLDLARSFVKEVLFVPRDRQKPLFNLTGRYYMRLASLVMAAQRRGEVDPTVPAPLAAHQLFGLYTWSLLNWFSGNFLTREQTTAFTRSSLELFIRGLAAAPPANPSTEVTP